MGAGAGSGRSSPSHCNGSRVSGISSKDSPMDSRDMVEGSVQWLLHAVDKEKHEKEWLAQKYDEKCNELSELQRDLKATQRELACHRQEESRRHQARGMATGPVEKAQSDNAAWDLRSPCKAAPGGSEVTLSPSGKLKDRRGLSLSIQTPGKLRSGVDLASPVPEEGRPVQSAAAAANAEEYALPPEPQSALLKRRQSWTIGQDDGDDGGAALMHKISSIKSTSSVVRYGSLSVKPDKVSKLTDEDDEDVPLSPKRVIR